MWRSDNVFCFCSALRKAINWGVTGLFSRIIDDQKKPVSLAKLPRINGFSPRR
jgi:adenylate cyclase